MSFPRRRFGYSTALLILSVALFAPSLVQAAAHLRLSADGLNRVVLELDLDGLEITPQTSAADGRQGLAIRSEGTVSLMQKGAPELPVVRRAILIDDASDVEVRVLERQIERRSVTTVLPSKGHLVRDHDVGATAYEFGPVYRSDQFFPNEEAILHDPFVVRDFRGVVVELRPVRYNPVTGQLLVTTRMVVEVVSKPGTGTNAIERSESVVGIDREFAPIYENLFANWGMERNRYAVLPEPGRCLILTADPFYDAVVPLLEWDLQKGIPTLLTRLSEVGGTANDIKTYIQSLYDAPEGLTYVVLVGDAAEMPYLLGSAEGAPSDPMYVKLAGDDDYPDALISRITAQNVTQVETQVARFLRYEKQPDVGEAGAWYHRATGIASAQYGGGAYDYQRADWLRDSLLTYTFTEVDRIYSPNAMKQLVIDAINAGRSLINYIGHGSETYWTTSGFNVQDVYALQNGFRNPYICDVACVNGDFTYNESFAEAWLRAGTAAEPKGAIAIYAASTDASWVPPCDMQTEVVRLMTHGISTSLGGISFNGVMKAMDLWPGYEATKLMEQYHLFGDCTVQIRTDAPAPLTLEHEGLIQAGQATYLVVTPGVAGARVALYADQVLYGAAYTDVAGQGLVSLDPIPPVGTTLTLTATAFNYETVIETVPVVPSSDAAVVVQTWSAMGEEIEVGRVVTLDVELRNDGTETAVGVTAILRGVGGTASIADSLASFGDIDPQASLWGIDSFSFTPNPNLPDSSEVALALEVTTTDGWVWDDTLRVTVLAPSFAYRATIVDDSGGDNDRRCDPAEEPSITIGICNEGSVGARTITAQLLTLDPNISIVQAEASLDTLAADSTAYLGSAFQLVIDPGYPEKDADFTLLLATEAGTEQEVLFSLPVGGWLEAVESGGVGCTHDAPDGFVDSWHVSTEGNVTPGGSHAWKCGAVADSTYAALCDARLTLPSLSVSGSSTLVFWHRIDAEIDSSQAGIAFDGGIVEISQNGGPFEMVTPVGGYPYQFGDSGTGGPFAAGIPCFSGTSGWTRSEVDLSGYGGSVVLRFRFGSDAAGGYQGWFLDDIEVAGLDATVDAPEARGVVAALSLLPARPNPFNPVTRIDLVIPSDGRGRLLILDPTGRTVRTLVDGPLAAGRRTVVWDGCDDRGHPLPSGVYYSYLVHDGVTCTGRLVMLK